MLGMMLCILLLLGMFMDQLAMMLLTVPIFFVIAGLDFGMELPVVQIWFGVIMLLAMEISFTTPLFGLLLFVMQGVAPPGTRPGEICRRHCLSSAAPCYSSPLLLLFRSWPSGCPF